MSRRAAATQREIESAVKGVQRAGLVVTGVKIDGTQILVLTNPGEASGPQSTAADLDRELAEFEARHGNN